jgi:hypothetical protein
MLSSNGRTAVGLWGWHSPYFLGIRRRSWSYGSAAVSPRARRYECVTAQIIKEGLKKQ